MNKVLEESKGTDDTETQGTHIQPPSWKRRSKKFFDDSTFNGALYVFASSRWEKKLFWAIVLSLAIGGFVAITALNIETLIREPIATSITLTKEESLAFPAVTICSLSLLNATKILGPGVTDNLYRLFLDVREHSDLTSCKVRANQVATGLNRNVSWGELINIAHNDLSVLLLRCVYDGQKCSVDDFEPINTVAGRCYTFNRPSPSQPPRMATGTGIRQGLQLQLSPDNKGLFGIEGDFGYRIVIHNPDELPRPESDGIAVGLISNTYIGMRLVVSVDKTKFSSGHQCREDTHYEGQKLSFPGYSLYSPSLCQTECFFS